MFAICDSTKWSNRFGAKGTKVRLLVIPASATDPAQRKTVELVRDEIKLKDQEARADIIIKKDRDGNPVKLGWLTLPSFYADMDSHKKSTTKDVLALLKRLKREKISGLVIDLRRNGGGSLEEAISLTGLFFKSGPVVQTKGANERVVIFDRPGSGHCLRWSARCPDQPAKRIRERDFRGGLAGLRPCRGRRRQKHFRQGDRANHPRNWPFHFASRHPFAG